MKILLIGGTGLLGSALIAALRHKQHIVDAPSRMECDITSRDSLEHFLKQGKFSFVINAAAYTNVDSAESESEKANLLNAEGPKLLAQLLPRDIPLLQWSTDYVFSGDDPKGYSEDGAPKPISAYGLSKLDGERAVMNYHPRSFIVRTAWLFGEGGDNFVDRMIRLAETEKTVHVVDDQVGSPTYAKDLADGVLPLLSSSAYGIYHLVNQGFASRYEMAQEIFQLLGLPVTVERAKSSDFPAAARRPRYSMLLNSKLPQLRSWRQALAEYLQHKVVTYQAL